MSAPQPGGFPDYFSAVSGSYAAFRPSYPQALFARLATLAPARRQAWDCATGNGQAALGLTSFFERVAATDASAQQIAHAQPHAKVAYALAQAEAVPFRDRSVDLITVAQAVHWFDLEGFWSEVRRVGAPGAAIAVWCYVRLTVDGGSIDREINAFYDNIVGPFWPAGRAAVEEGYRTLPFPFPEVRVDGLSLERAMSLRDLGGYLRTWSATQGYTAHHGHDPVHGLLHRLAVDWGEPDTARLVRWPLFVRAGHLPARPLPG